MLVRVVSFMGVILNRNDDFSWHCNLSVDVMAYLALLTTRRVPIFKTVLILNHLGMLVEWTLVRPDDITRFHQVVHSTPDGERHGDNG